MTVLSVFCIRCQWWYQSTYENTITHTSGACVPEKKEE